MLKRVPRQIFKEEDMKTGIQNIGARRGRFLRTSLISLACIFSLAKCGSNSNPNNVANQQGPAQALLFVSNGPVYDFGMLSVGQSIDQTFTVDNVGAAAATSINGTFAVSAFAYSGGSFPGTGGTCGSELAAQTTCTVVVTYAPTYYAGTFSDTFRITYQSSSGVNAVTASPIVQGETGNTN